MGEETDLVENESETQAFKAHLFVASRVERVTNDLSEQSDVAVRALCGQSSFGPFRQPRSNGDHRCQNCQRIARKRRDDDG